MQKAKFPSFVPLPSPPTGLSRKVLFARQQKLSLPFARTYRKMIRNLVSVGKHLQRGQKSLFSTVQENTIRLTFVDREGHRAVLPALVGSTLLDAARMHKIDLEGPCRGGSAPTDKQRTEIWNEQLFGEGPTCFVCHVQIPPQFHHLLPQQSMSEVPGLKREWGTDCNASSRLACQIVLEHKHNGMIVFVPDAPPVDVI